MAVVFSGYLQYTTGLNSTLFPDLLRNGSVIPTSKKANKKLQTSSRVYLSLHSLHIRYDIFFTKFIINWNVPGGTSLTT